MDGTNSEVHATLTIASKVRHLKIGSHIVGNFAVCDVLLDDPSVDVKHAVLDVSRNTVKLMDLFSVHGTYVEGKKVKKFEVIELQKNAKLQFGSVQCQFRISHESDSGFLGISNSSICDTSIIPNSPIANEPKRNIIQKSITSTPTAVTVQSQIQSINDDAVKENDNSFLVKATQNEPGDDNIFGDITDNSLQRNGFEEDDDFFIPETQEIFQKRSIQNESCDFFQLNTQEFRGEINEASNDSDKFFLSDSMHVPFIAPPQKGDFVNDVQFEDMAKDQPAGNDVGGDNDDTDCEEEMSILNWNETVSSDKSNPDTTKSASVTPDLELGNKEAEIGEEMAMKATQVFTLLKANRDESIHTTSDNEEEDGITNAPLELTQAFILPKIVVNDKNDQLVTNQNPAEGTSSLEETQVFNFKTPLQPPPIRPPVIELDDDLAPTQVFNPIRSNQPSPITPPVVDIDDGLAPTQAFKPIRSNQTPPIRSPVAELDDDLAPTQIFHTIKSNNKITPVQISTIENADSDLDPTQPFVFTKPFVPREASKSPVLLDSDEEDDSEFSLQPTLVISDDAPSLKRFSESPKKPKLKKVNNKLFGSSDEEDDDDLNKTNCQPEAIPAFVQPTPDFAFIKLPDVNKICAADDLFQKTSKPVMKSLLQESSDEDEERHNSSEQMNRLLNESRAVPVSNKTTRSKRITRKASASSDKVEKASTKATKKIPAKSKKESLKNKKTTEESKASVTRKTRVNDKIKSDQTTDDTKTTGSAIQLPIRTSSRNKCLPDQQKKPQQHHHQNESLDSDDSIVKISAGKSITTKSEIVEKSATKRHQPTSSSDDSGPKKRSKENIPTTSHVAIEGVTPMRKTPRQKHRIVFTKLDSKPYENLIEKIDVSHKYNTRSATKNNRKR